MKHNFDVPGQLALFAIAPTEIRTIVQDPYWDAIETAPEHPQPEQRWNPSHFGEVPHKVDGDGQLTIFYDDSEEPPDPEDFENLNDYHRAWSEWEILVRAQVTSSTSVTTVQTPVRAQVTSSTSVTTVETLVRAQVTLDTRKVAPEHNTHWVEKYWVERSGNKYWYFRYCWMAARKKNRVHLGSVTSIVAKRRKADIEVWIADGKVPIEILKLIRGLKNDYKSSTMPKMPPRRTNF